LFMLEININSLFAHSSLDHHPPILVFCHSWDDRCVPPFPAFVHWDAVSQTFLPGTVILPISASYIPWDDWLMLPNPAISWEESHELSARLASNPILTIGMNMYAWLLVLFTAYLLVQQQTEVKTMFIWAWVYRQHVH
jgi:hypothetical protein